MFIERFVSILSQDFIEQINAVHELMQYVYIPADRIFRSHETMLAAPGNWKNLLETGRERVQQLPITYINGKYIRQQVIETIDPGKPMKRTIISFHPQIIMYLAKIIHYHLLNELKNVKK